MQADTHVSPGQLNAPATVLQIRPLVYVLVGLFIAAAVVYGAIKTGQPPDVVLTLFSTRFLGIFIEAVPFLLLGTLTSGLIEAFIRTDDLMRYLPRNPVLATICGAFLGIIFPVCECGVVPVVRRLFMKGLPVSMGITFLLAAPLMNPLALASTYIAFGAGTVFIGRIVLTVIVSIGVGLVFALTARPEEVLQMSSMMTDDGFEMLQPRKTLRQGMMTAVNVAGSEFFEMGRFLVMGCLMAAALQTFIPQEALLAAGTGPISSVLIMQAFAFILSICSTVDAFLALAFTTTFTTGAILAFLSFGPMVDIKSTMMFTGIFKRKAVFILVLLPFLMNLFAGVMINLSLGYF
jgi:uncharacterized membrane protein YraQ (UPF0718 family)